MSVRASAEPPGVLDPLSTDALDGAGDAGAVDPIRASSAASAPSDLALELATTIAGRAF